jgi:vitamin B12 transporter
MASLTLGSRSTSDLTAGYNLNHEGWRMGISLQRFDTQGYSAMNPDQNASVNPDKDGFERESVFVSADKTLSGDVVVGLQVSDIQSRVAYDSGFASSVDAQNSRQESSSFTAYSRFSLAPDWSSRLSVTQSSFENRDFQNGAPNGSFDGDQESLGWNNTFRLNHGHVVFGAEAVNARFKTPASYQRESSGYHLGYSGQQARLDYQLNLRHDQIDSRSASAASRASASTWLMGLGYWLTDEWKVTGLASTAFRAPHVGELFDTAFTTGNPNLEPEKHRGIEVGISNKSHLGLLRVVRFQSTTRNAIEYRFGPPDYFNIGKVQNKGFEVSLQGDRAGWSYHLNAVRQDPRNAVNGTRLARRAKDYGSLALGKAAMGVNWDAQVVWSGNRVDGVRVLPSYTVLNLTAAKRLTASWMARLRVENAFNRKYQLAYGYDAVPRGVFLTLQYQPR